MLRLHTVTCLAALFLREQRVSLALPEARFDPVNRRLVADGNVLIAALLPITRADRESGSCVNSKPVSNFILHFIEPLLFVLRSHNFSLSARLPNGSWTHLSLGYVIGDQCESGDVTDSVKFVLDIAKTSPEEKSPSTCRGRQQFSAADRELVMAPIVGLVGPWRKDKIVRATAPITSAYNLVQIASRINNDEFSCIVPGSSHGNCNLDDEYRFLFRAGSSDRYQAYAIADLLRYFNWTHFAVVVAEDNINLSLLEIFLKQVKLHKLCPAFVAYLGSKEDATEINRLLRQHSAAKVVVTFAGRKTIELLLETLWEESFRRKENIPRTWIGTDKCRDHAEDIPFGDADKHAGTIEGTIALWPTIPENFDDWHWPPLLMRQFEEFMLSITAGDLRRNPRLTGNPLLCYAMEEMIGCSGVCSRSSKSEALDSQNASRCEDNVKLQKLHPNIHGNYFDLVDPFAMFSADILINSLQKLFQETVNDIPDLPRRQLRKVFFESARGSRLVNLVKHFQLPCNDNELCRVFPGGSQELLPQYEFSSITNSNNKSKATRFGMWRMNDFLVDSENMKMKIDQTNVFFGRSLYPQNDQKYLQTLVRASASIPISSCTPTCHPGWGRLTAPYPQPVCCHICRPCVGGEFSSGGLTSECRPCEQGFAPDLNKTQCDLLPVRRFINDSAFMWFIFFVLSLVESLTVLTMVVFVRFSTSDVIRSSDWRLSVSILLAMGVGTPGVCLRLVGTASNTCAASRLLTIIPAMWISCTVLVKTSRLARIHFIAKNMDPTVKPRRSLTSMAQFMAIFAVLLVGFSLEILIFSC